MTNFQLNLFDSVLKNISPLSCLPRAFVKCAAGGGGVVVVVRGGEQENPFKLCWRDKSREKNKTYADKSRCYLEQKP